MPAGGPAAANQPGGQDLGFVQHQGVAGPQQQWQFADVLVGDRAGSPVDDHQPGVDPVGCRLLGDQVLGERIIVLVDFGHV